MFYTTTIHMKKTFEICIAQKHQKIKTKSLILKTKGSNIYSIKKKKNFSTSKESLITIYLKEITEYIDQFEAELTKHQEGQQKFKKELSKLIKNPKAISGKLDSKSTRISDKQNMLTCVMDTKQQYKRTENNL